MLNMILGWSKHQKYRVRLFWTVILVITIVLLVFTSVLYSFTRRTAVTLQQEANRKVLNQVVYNLDYLNSTLQSLTLASYKDRNIITLLRSESLDDFQTYNRMYTLNAIVNANRFLDSVWIYNATSGCTYSSTVVIPVSCAESGSDPAGAAADPDNLVETVLRSDRSLPMLKLLPMDAPTRPASESGLFAYVMYDSYSGYKQGQSLLMLVVRADWVLDNIKKINEATGKIGEVFVIDESGRTYLPSGGKLDAGLVRSISARLDKDPERAIFFTARSGGSKYFVTASRAEESGWTSVSVQPYSAVYGGIDRMAKYTLLSLLGFILIGVLVSGVVATRLYRPVDRLVRSLPNMGSGGLAVEEERDELLLVERAYRRMRDSLDEMQTDRSEIRRRLEAYNIQRLLTDSRSLKAEEAAELLVSSGFTPPAEDQYAVVVLRIDDYAAFLRTRGEQERKLCLFAIANIAQEIVGERFANRAADMKSDHVAMLIRLDRAWDGSTAADALWGSLLKPVQTALSGYYRLSLTAAVSDAFADIREASGLYEQARGRSLRRFTLGKGAIVTSAEARNNEGAPDANPIVGSNRATSSASNAALSPSTNAVADATSNQAPGIASHAEGEPWKLPFELQKKLADSVRAGDKPALSAVLEAARDYFARLPAHALDHAVLRLLTLIDQALYEREDGGRPLPLSLNSFLREALEQETLDDLFGLIGRLTEEIAESDARRGSAKNVFLVDMIKDLTELNYRDPGYSLQAIADAMKMSAAYLGRCFREQEGLSVADWITEVRLGHAIALLERSDKVIGEVMRETGFVSESSFFKWFKKKTGMTPKDYRLHVLRANAK